MSTQTKCCWLSSTKSHNKAHSHRSGLYKRSASHNRWCRHGVLCCVLMRETWILSSAGQKLKKCLTFDLPVAPFWMSFKEPGAIKLLMHEKGNEKYNKKKSYKVPRQKEKYSTLALSSFCQNEETSMGSWNENSSCLNVITGDLVSYSRTLKPVRVRLNFCERSISKQCSMYTKQTLLFECMCEPSLLYCDRWQTRLLGVQ